MTLTEDRADALVEFESPIGYDVVVAPEYAEGQWIYVARHPQLPRCLAQGSSPDEAIANLDTVREDYLADMRAAGVPVAPAQAYPRKDVMESVSQEEAPAAGRSGTWRVVSGPATMHIVSWRRGWVKSSDRVIRP